MPVKTSPMDSERPKTPSWAFTAPDLVKNSKVMLLPFFPFKLCYCSPFLHLWKMNLALSVFGAQNPAHTRVPQNGAICRTVNGISPQGRRCWAHGGPYGHVPRIKSHMWLHRTGVGAKPWPDPPPNLIPNVNLNNLKP
jgi:hypothetical protein